MPRLSVDIGLAYMPRDERVVAQARIDAALDGIVAALPARPYAFQVQPGNGRMAGYAVSRIAETGAEIKIEVAPVLLICRRHVGK